MTGRSHLCELSLPSKSVKTIFTSTARIGLSDVFFVHPQVPPHPLTAPSVDAQSMPSTLLSDEAANSSTV